MTRRPDIAFALDEKQPGPASDLGEQVKPIEARVVALAPGEALAGEGVAGAPGDHLSPAVRVGNANRIHAALAPGEAARGDEQFDRQLLGRGQLFQCQPAVGV